MKNQERAYTVENYFENEDHNCYDHGDYIGTDKTAAERQYINSQVNAQRELESSRYKYGESVTVIMNTYDISAEDLADLDNVTELENIDDHLIDQKTITITKADSTAID